MTFIQDPIKLDSYPKVLYSIIIPDSDLFQSSTHLNSQGSIQWRLPLWVQCLTRTHSHYIHQYVMRQLFQFSACLAGNFISPSIFPYQWLFSVHPTLAWGVPGSQFIQEVLLGSGVWKRCLGQKKLLSKHHVLSDTRVSCRFPVLVYSYHYLRQVTQMSNMYPVYRV